MLQSMAVVKRSRFSQARALCNLFEDLSSEQQLVCSVLPSHLRCAAVRTRGALFDGNLKGNYVSKRAGPSGAHVLLGTDVPPFAMPTLDLRALLDHDRIFDWQIPRSRYVARYGTHIRGPVPASGLDES